MIEQTDTTDQMDLLDTYKNNLDHLLMQAAKYGGEAYAPLDIINQINDQRTSIQSLEESIRAGDPVAQTLATFVTPEQRNRARMLAKVRAFWIEGVLDRSIDGGSLIALGLTYQVHDVDQGWNVRLHVPDKQAQMLAAGTPIINVFDTHCGEVLILGDPGSGKTTVLLELTRALLTRAERVATTAIPVVFNLSSWGERQPPIEEWLVDELNIRYDVPRKIGQMWVAADQILPLLDGLDEVRHEHHKECVTAINHFRREHGMVNIVVCSRSADYARMGAKLNLQGAITVQPLTFEQISDYLIQINPHMANFVNILQSDEGLRESVQTPLMLNVMALIYKDMPADMLPTQMSREEWHKNLFSAYVERIFQRENGEVPYSAKQTLLWLVYLARKMREQAQTTFFIEHMQAEWLPDKNYQRIYTFSISIASGLILGITSGFIGLGIAGIGVGLTMLLMGWLVWSISWGRARPVVVATIYGIGVGLAGWFAIGNIEPLSRGVFGMAMMIFTGLGSWIGAWHAHRDHIESVEKLRWSWKKGLIPALIVGAGNGLLTGSYIGFAVGILTDANQGLMTGIALGLAGALTAALITLLTAGLTSGEISTRTMPNQGIRRSARTAARIGLLFLLICAPSFALIGLMLRTWASALITEPMRGLANWSSMGITGGLGGMLMGAFAFGGAVCLQHLILRLMLTYSGVTPWSYAYFLDYAAERVFLRKVGGGYMFVHRLLLDYFADLPISNLAPIAKQSVKRET